MDEHFQFKENCSIEIQQQGEDSSLIETTKQWMIQAEKQKYSYHFEWLGRPIIQHPQDIVALQELIWKTQPDLIIETGIARGGSLILYASILELIAACGGNPTSKIIGIDIDIRPHNKDAILSHPMAKRIEMIQGSSISEEIVSMVYEKAKHAKKIMVLLDSNHTHEHVLEELKYYAPLTSKGSYCVVFDTIIEDMPENTYVDRPWNKGNNPKTAVFEYLSLLNHHPTMGEDGQPLQMQIDKRIDNQLLITVAPDGFLLRT